MPGWDLLLRTVILLAAAAAAGLLMRRLRQNVIVGFLLAGLVMGPSGVGLVRSSEDVQFLSELGVALLLFSIGLEFSLKRLRELGRVATLGGPLQILATAAVVWLAASAWGLASREALVLGLGFAMSSTAVVLRTLTERAELESPHGKIALGILLAQDMAVVPVLMLVEAMAKATAAADLLAQISLRGALVVAFALGAWLVARYFLPRLLSAAALSGNRDLLVVVAVCLSAGAAWAAHALGFSAALGAFMAGILLAESPFATLLRADVAPLGAVFVTLFFASVGTAVQLPWDGAYLAAVLLAAVAVMFGDAVIVAVIVWLFRRSLRTAVIAGLVLSQVGEFTFVVVDRAFRDGVLSAGVFQFSLAVTLVTLALTPFVISAAPGLAAGLRRSLPRGTREALDAARPPVRGKVIVVGYGPAGQQVVRRLQQNQIPFLVLEMNPGTVAQHRADIPIELGDATQREALQHAGLALSRALVVSTPDPGATRLIASQAARIAPGVPVIARSRYQQLTPGLLSSGVDQVADEERLVGEELGVLALRAARPTRAGE